MELSFGNMKVKLNIFTAFQQPLDQNECYLIDYTSDVVDEALPYLLSNDPLEVCLSHFGIDDFDTEQYINEVKELLNKGIPNKFPPWRPPKEELPLTVSKLPVTSLESPPKLELKQLPQTLKYAFLGKDETLPVIIASNLH